MLLKIDLNARLLENKNGVPVVIFCQGMAQESPCLFDPPECVKSDGERSECSPVLKLTYDTSETETDSGSTSESASEDSWEDAQGPWKPPDGYKSPQDPKTGDTSPAAAPPVLRPRCQSRVELDDQAPPPRRLRFRARSGSVDDDPCTQNLVKALEVSRHRAKEALSIWDKAEADLKNHLKRAMVPRIDAARQKRDAAVAEFESIQTETEAKVDRQLKRLLRDARAKGIGLAEGR